jgi:hemerythrin-like domain-containing protein
MKPNPAPGDEHPRAGSSPVFDRMRAEHAYVLEAVDALERAALGPRASARTPFPVAAARPLAERLAREFASHASAEDDVLVPLLAGGLPDGQAYVRQLVAEHAELRAMLVAFLATLSRSESAARDEQLRVQARDLTALMRSQIRKEETLVFAIAERQVARDASTHRPSGRPAAREAPPTRPRPNRGDPQ